MFNRHPGGNDRSENGMWRDLSSSSLLYFKSHEMETAKTYKAHVEAHGRLAEGKILPLVEDTKEHLKSLKSKKETSPQSSVPKIFAKRCCEVTL
jgi:hypothetical protein